jgi:exopolysaccharide production protein ExoF
VTVRFWHHLKTGLGFFCAALPVVLALSGAAWAAEPYRLSVSDRISIKVVEWLPSQGEFREWTAVGGEASVGANGSVSLPFLGEAAAAGKSVAELGQEFSQGLQQHFGLNTAPDVTVGIVAFAPVFVTGDVQTPGQFAFTPGLNVIKAVSLAGGERISADALLRGERDLISASGSAEVARGKLQRLLARRSRLETELAGQATVPVPEELRAVENGAAVVVVEQAILRANASRAEAQAASLRELIDLLNRELTTLAQKQATVERQLEIARRELENIQSLASEGLAANTRVSAIEGNVAELETRLLDIGTAILRAQQSISDTTRNLAALDNDRTADLTAELQQVDGQIDELNVQINTQQALMTDAVILGAELDAEQEQRVAYGYTIVRGETENSGTQTTELQPGDVVKVTRSLNLGPQ